MSTFPTTDTPTTLTVIPWADPVIETHGHRPGSPYIELVWLGTLGPSATWAWQRLARHAATTPSCEIDATDLAVSLGLGEGLGRHAPLSRTLNRLVGYHAAYRNHDTLAVRLALPDLPEHRLGRLSLSARHAHDHLTRRLQTHPGTA